MNIPAELFSLETLIIIPGIPVLIFKNDPLKLLQLIMITSEGVQNRPCQERLLWHVDYFELQAMETLQSQEKLLPQPLKNLNWVLFHNKSYYWK